MIFHYDNKLILVYDVLSSYMLYYVQFKEVEISWGPRAGGWGPGVGYGGQITQAPFYTS